MGIRSSYGTMRVLPAMHRRCGFPRPVTSVTGLGMTGGIKQLRRFSCWRKAQKGDGTETVPYDIALLCGKPCSIPKLFVDKDYVQLIEKTGFLLDYRRDGADALCMMAVHTFAGDGAGRVEAEPLRVL